MTDDKKEKTSVKDVIQVDNELLDNISILIDNQSTQSLLNIFADLHEADIAEIINHLDVNDATYVFELLDTGTAGEVITEVDENLRERILQQIDRDKITDIVEELETDDATDIVSDLPETVAEHVLENIDIEYSEEVKQLLAYPEDSAGGIMDTDFVNVDAKASVKDAIDEVRKNADEFENIYHIYVLHSEGILSGIVTLKSLLVNPLDTEISSIMEEDLIYVKPDMDQEEVAEVMEKYDLVAVPVVDENKKMLGRITIDDVVDVIQEEASEDMSKIAGLSDEEEISDSVFRITRIRLPWLVIALAVELISAVLLSKYEEFIQQFAIAAAFIPIVMAMGGSTGTQAAIVMVRGLGMREVWFRDSIKKLGKEFMVAILNGLACAILLFGATLLLFPGNTDFTAVLSASLLTVIIVATMVGASIPLILRRMGMDPAAATGPFVTSMNDVIGLTIYILFTTAFFL